MARGAGLKQALNELDEEARSKSRIYVAPLKAPGEGRLKRAPRTSRNDD